MIAHDGVKVEFRIDDVAFPEYLVEKDLVQKKVMCWIPSQIGKVSTKILYECRLSRFFQEFTILSQMNVKGN